jgi:hypothetical protein
VTASRISNSGGSVRSIWQVQDAAEPSRLFQARRLDIAVPGPAFDQRPRQAVEFSVVLDDQYGSTFQSFFERPFHRISLDAPALPVFAGGVTKQRGRMPSASGPRASAGTSLGRAVRGANGAWGRFSKRSLPRAASHVILFSNAPAGAAFHSTKFGSFFFALASRRPKRVT